MKRIMKKLSKQKGTINTRSNEDILKMSERTFKVKRCVVKLRRLNLKDAIHITESEEQKQKLLTDQLPKKSDQTHKVKESVKLPRPNLKGSIQITEPKKQKQNLLPDQPLEGIDQKHKVKRCVVKLRRRKAAIELPESKMPKQNLLTEQKLKGSDQTHEVKRSAKLRQLKAVINLKESEKQKQNLLPDQPLKINDQTHKIKRCVVKLRRLKEHPKNVTEQKTSEQNDDQFVQESSVSQQFSISQQINQGVTEFAQNSSLLPDINNLNRSLIFKNPSLSLTTRRARELGLKKCSPNKTNTKNTLSLQKSPQNLVGKSNLIADILLSNESVDEENLILKNGESQKVAISRPDFHKTKKTSSAITKRTKKVWSQRKTTISSSKDVYDFLSQSQTSDSDKDPAADVIKKLIARGKVAVTRNVKGRPITIRKRVTKKKISIKKPKQKVVIENKPNNVHEADTSDIENENNDDFIENVVEEEQAPVSTSAKEVTTVALEENNTSIINHGTFSDLARSVLMQQSKIKRPTTTIIQSKEILAKNTYKHFSTPYKTQQNAELPNPIDFSPIPSANNSINNTIPKHVSFQNSFDENTPQAENKSKSVLFSFGPRNESVLRNRTELKNASLSSFSSNDSNAENLPPPTSRLPYEDNTDQNSIIHSARQFSNPRRALGPRSPLKCINIIDVVILPPYKPEENNNSKTNENVNKSHESDALFGFEEYIDDNLSDKTEDESTYSEISKASTSNIHIQRQRLKKYRQKKTHKKSDNTKSTAKHIFTDNFNTKRNHNIKEMFCSTMINVRPSKDLASTSNCLSSDSDGEENNDTSKQKKVDLFGDPESTFDHNVLQRTYERPYKRKRKLAHQYSVCLDSDDNSEDEDVQSHSPAKVAKYPDKKRQCIEKNHNKELEKFAAEFNSMIEEAENYELIVQ